MGEMMDGRKEKSVQEIIEGCVDSDKGGGWGMVRRRG